MGRVRQPDWQKREAKSSLWNLDGKHENKRSRNKGKARSKDKALIREQLEEMYLEPYWHEDDVWREIDEAIYCHHYGPCSRCRS